VGFEQAAIKVDREKEFQELKRAIERAFEPRNIEKFLKKVRSRNLRIRDFEAVLAGRALEESGALAGPKAKVLHQVLTLSDQAQMREFYLSRVEEVDPKLRTKFQKVYRYY